MLAFRPIVLLFALIGLSSCAYSPDNSVFTGSRCTTANAEHLEGVNWDKATKLNLRIRQDDFLPVYMGLLQKHSYVLAIENGDDREHSFRAMEFFRAVAVAGVRLNGGDFESVSCLKGVSIPARSVTEIRLVAIRDGSYEFDDNALMFSLAMIGSAGGFITIEQPRVLTGSPLEHLKLFDRKAIEPVPEETKPTGLFDDQNAEPAPAPGGLFDDQEQPPADPPSGLFDDPAPEQPIDGSPSVPVETAPSEGLFSDPSLEPLPGTTKTPDAPVVETPSPVEPSESMFSEPSLEPLPGTTETPDAPVAPLVDTQPEISPEAPVVDAQPETRPVGELDKTLEEMPASPPETLVLEPVDSETDMMMEEAPTQEGTPIPSGEGEEFTVEEVPAVLQEQPPVTIPQDFVPLDGPPADIFSDPPDVVKSGPGSEGAAGDDKFDGSG